MAYQSLYRKYRPKHLDEVVGQEHILEVLNHSLKKDMISHAYLFCGPRGTGKTSIAKLFAQSINCETPGAIACGHCDNCIEGAAGRHPDIVEIDAASNNGVDEIRGLIDRIKYTPILGKYKVYIIDEVHMLTAGAFNAFLKTLEEPPEHAVFVLATTEIHKVIPTIVSRCQRFDFNNLSDAAIRGRLDSILNLEHVQAQEGVTQMVASLSNGALRNALTILEQAIIVADPEITLDQVHRLNGVITARQKYSLIQAILGDDMNRLNSEINILLENTVDVERLIMDLVKTMKDTVIFQYTKSSEHTTYSEKTLVEFLAPRVDTKTLLNMVETLLEYVERMKFSHSQESYLQIALIKLFNQKNQGVVITEHLETVVKEEVNSIALPHETNIKPADVTLKPMENKVEESKLGDSMDSPVHVQQPVYNPEGITHLEREYHDDVMEPKLDKVSEQSEIKPLNKENHIGKSIPTNRFESVEIDRDSHFPGNITHENNMSGTIQNDEIIEEIIFEEIEENIIEDVVEVADSQFENIIEESIEELIEPVAEPVVSITTKNTIEVDPMLSIPQIIQFMVSANKDLRMIDEINFKSIENYIHDYEWAKCARLIGQGDLVLSGDYFVMVCVDQELEVKEIMEPINNIELNKFSKLIFNTEKRIYSCTREMFTKAVAEFRNLSASKNLPQPLTKEEIQLKTNEIKEEQKDVKLDKVQELFGNQLNIIK